MKSLASKLRQQSPTPTGSKCSKSLQSKSVTPNAILRSEMDGGPRKVLNDDGKSGKYCMSYSAGKVILGNKYKYIFLTTNICQIHKYLPLDKSIYKGKGTRYITEDLIRRITKCENLVLVQTLDLSSSTGHDKQFRVRFGNYLVNAHSL